MPQSDRIFQVPPRSKQIFTLGDVLAVFFIIAVLYVGVRLAFATPREITGPQISLSPSALPWYTMLSVGRMLAAYILSIIFTMVYGRAAARNPNAEQVLMPLLDVLQSVPILSFLPVTLLGLSVFLPENIAAEFASIVLIFTSQVWNMTFSWYQSLTTIPKDLREASTIFHLNSWMKFKSLELPFGMISLVWNSMISWAGGWFFLMAAETFTVGKLDFRLPGLGSYLQAAANHSDYRAITWGLLALVVTIVLLDQLVWRPLLAWSERFKVEMIESDRQTASWFYDVISRARLVEWLSTKVIQPLVERIDQNLLRKSSVRSNKTDRPAKTGWLGWAFMIAIGLGVAYFILNAAVTLLQIPGNEWQQLFLGLLATLGRVVIALTIALLWTIPFGVLIGTNQRLATIFQPIIQVLASIPATGLFPIILLLLVDYKNGLNLAAIFLMLLGTQWYLLFNIIAGASAIPQDLKNTTRMLNLRGFQRWRTLILPAIFPYLITGAITASGGAWNASIVAEYHQFGGKTLSTVGVGALISQATASGNYSLLLAATISMIVTVVVLNRLIWRRLYKLAEEKYRLEGA